MLEIVHQVPNIIGKHCTRLLNQQFWLDGRLAENGNVIFIEVENVWHRFFFDSGTFHWREDVAMAMPSTKADKVVAYSLVDLELPPSTIDMLSLTVHLGNKLEFLVRFSNGALLTLTEQNNESDCEFVNR